MTQRGENLEHVSAEMEAAFVEAKDAFNAAKKSNGETITLKRRSLYLLLVLAAHAVGITIEDASKLN